MKLGNVARVVAVSAACVAAVGSATSTSNNQQAPQQPQVGQNSPPPAQQMEASRALGLWRSTFGAVKIEADESRGGLQTGNVQGVWVYQRQGQEVVGYFAGNLRGNVLQFRWQEPNTPPLTGEGYLVFDPTGRQYSGRWWSDHRDRVGDWNGWRQDSAQAGGAVDASYGGQPEGEPPPAGGYQQPQQPMPPPRTYAPPPRQQAPQPPPSQTTYY